MEQNSTKPHTMGIPVNCSDSQPYIIMNFVTEQVYSFGPFVSRAYATLALSYIQITRAIIHSHSNSIILQTIFYENCVWTTYQYPYLLQ